MNLFPSLAGVDEAGRGAFAGPVMTAAVLLSGDQPARLVELGLRDSKKMTPRSRERVFSAMAAMGVCWSAQAATAARIDGTNILKATLWAMKKSVEKLPQCLLDGVLVDGNQEIPGLSLSQQALPGGDDLCPQISAASVVAKVLRDRIMVAMDSLYPGYGFASHKGYGTSAHREAMEKLGLSPIHRKSFHWRG